MSLAAYALTAKSGITEEQGTTSDSDPHLRISSECGNNSAWNYGHTHPIIPPHTSPEVEVERRLSTLSCSPLSFQKKKPNDVSKDRLLTTSLPVSFFQSENVSYMNFVF